MPTFNLIGAGQVGQTLAYLITQHTPWILGQVLNRSLPSATKACTFIGRGQPTSNYTDLTPADVYLIAVPDQSIATCAEKLVATQILRPTDLVIHCSGVLPATELKAVQSSGAQIASLHPVKSFVDPALSTQTFTGTYCGIEGDTTVLPLLHSWVNAIGGKAFTINPQQKLIYHSAFVFACNYLNVLTEISLRCLEKSSINHETAIAILPPLMRQTLEQIFIKGTAAALSGPIARGEHEVVRQELAALTAWQPEIGEAYQLLGQFATELAQAKGMDAMRFELLSEILKKSPH
jgi:predicted short-subunit dehydrogenase-like oxidoreductase (DUF2520 family)